MILKYIFHLIIIILIRSVLEVNVRDYIKKLNQLCLILIMFTVGLKFYPCLNGL